jgi:hypothetical protein
VLVDVGLDPELRDELRRPGHAHAHEASAEVIGWKCVTSALVIVYRRRRRLDDRVDLPRGVDHGGLARLGIADQVHVVLHRADLELAEIDGRRWSCSSSSDRFRRCAGDSRRLGWAAGTAA